MRRRLLAPLALVLLCSSCFTTGLWDRTLQIEEDGAVSGYDGPEKSSYGWEGVTWRVLLTPLAIALDVCTSPVQAFLYDWDDEDDDC